MSKPALELDGGDRDVQLALHGVLPALVLYDGQQLSQQRHGSNAVHCTV